MSSESVIHNSHLAGAPFLWEGGPVGILLAHGYTATTAEVRLLARHLYRQGYTIAGPLLPGHGATPDEMNRCRWKDWIEAMEDAYQLLRVRCERVIAGGESMGALLALYLAGEHPEIEAILAYAPALRLARKHIWGAYLLRPFIHHIAKAELKDTYWQGYAVNPLGALVQLHRLQLQVRRRLPHIKQPLLIVQGRLDTAIDLRGVEELYHNIGSPVKELHWMENSVHVVILDHELEQVVAVTTRFIERVLERTSD